MCGKSVAATKVWHTKVAGGGHSALLLGLLLALDVAAAGLLALALALLLLCLGRLGLLHLEDLGQLGLAGRLLLGSRLLALLGCRVDVAGADFVVTFHV